MKRIRKKATGKPPGKRRMDPPCDPDQVWSFDYSSPDTVFHSLSKPVQRALASHGICRAADLADHDLDEVMKWHGIGPSSGPKLEILVAGCKKSREKNGPGKLKKK